MLCLQSPCHEFTTKNTVENDNNNNKSELCFPPTGNCSYSDMMHCQADITKPALNENIDNGSSGPCQLGALIFWLGKSLQIRELSRG